ncbi:MAG: RluA family pseudouridine synthase [Candidatus Harrisonbacteria bacterium CG10_big_fil_rev_8_21_14_0_10_38_8]|uniref:RluA family pseudouridine synthase n=1 Tax=Candidatus Harrisonbacteria bacterium CG10_big_fil_rev_8_21_14_0_10_38_8 TaxID=1974582 RepID=A0A2M6WK36_9BACT|nr:MAG: RluA family pseudouridine synthase [Candidatus Harrisonbacteria bacterium CG10_big_fil_rev_8_21_14_0_10_38_8]
MDKDLIIKEEADYLVLNKPAGVLVHGIFDKYGSKHAEEVLTDWIIKDYPEIADVGDKPQERPGVVHRLDRETSGVLLVAKNQEAFLRLKDLFKTNMIKKEYLALVFGEVKENKGVIDKPISIKNGTVKRTVFKGKMPREAITYFEVIQRYVQEEESYTLLRVLPKTGRTHQIRVHLSSIGNNIVGDKLYGKKGTILNLDRHFLHAEKISFNYNGEEKEYTAKLPTDLENILNSLTEKEEAE